MRIDSAIITGSLIINGDTFGDLGAYTTTGSNTFVGNQSIVGAVSASALTGSISYTNLTNVPTLISGSEQIVSILSPLNSFTASNSTTNTFTSSATARLNSIETITASNVARLTSLEAITGSLATTGSNTFIGTQTITGSLYISSDLIVQGSSSLQNITASAVSIGTNIINLNTANPAIRYAGLSIGDSGSIGSSGSFLYDSVQDEFIFVHRGANTTVTSSVLLMGPQTYDSIGNETYLTTNRIPKGAGNEHLADSNISDTGTLVSINSATASFSGSVGIGTTTPSQSLHVAGRIYSVTSGTDGGQILLANSGGGSTWYWAARTTGLNLGELTAADGRIFIKNGGNVGIGTDNPGSKLTIRGTDSTSMLYLGISSSSTTGEAVGITFGSATYDKARIVAYNQNAGNAEGYLTFWTGGTPTTTDVSEKVRISSEGLVGIGTTGPDRLLHINGNTSTTTPLQKVQNTGIGDAVTEYRVTGASWYVGIDNSDSDKFKIGQDPLGTSDRFIIADGGYIGIGTTSPGDKLHVYASGYDANIRLTDAGVANADWSLLPSSGTTTAIFRLYNRATATTCTTWTTDGKVGIGTTSPTTLLHLSSTYNGGATGQMHMTSNGTEGGTITFEKTSGTAQKYKFGLGTNQLFVYNETAGNQPFTITSSGNVGIGATNPSKKLTVDGRMSTSAIVSGNLIAGNIYTNISTSPSYILITDLNNTAGFSMSGKVNAASYTCWNISDIWIEKDYSSTTARAGIVGSYKSGCDFSIVDISYGAGRYVALRFTSNPEIDVMFIGYRLADLYQSDGTATVVTSGVTVNGTYASY